MSNEQIERLMQKVCKRYLVVELSCNSDGVWEQSKLNIERTILDTPEQAEIRIAEILDESEWVNFEDNFLTIITVYETK